MHRFENLIVASIAIVFMGCSPDKTHEAHDELHQLFQEAWEFRLREDPLLATSVGDHRYNDRLPTVTITDHERRAQTTREFLDRLRTIDRSRLTPEDKISYDIFERQGHDEMAEFKNQAYLIPITNRGGFHIDFAELPGKVPFETVQDYENYLARLRAFANYVQQYVTIMRQGIARGFVMPKVVMKGYEASIAAHIVKDFSQSVFFRPFQSFPSTLPETDRIRLSEAGEGAIAVSVVPGYQDFLNFMVNEYMPSCRSTIGVSGLPGGRSYYEYLVRHYTTLEITPEEVHEIGLEEVERIRSEMLRIIEKMSFDGDLKSFIHFLRSDPRFYAKTAEALMREASYICKRMDGELPRLFQTLPRIPYGIKRIPEYVAPKTTGAYYEIPSGDGKRAGFYSLNTYSLRSRPLFTLEALSFHEAVPGHHLQLSLQQELSDIPQFRRFAEITAFVEGWALYAERLGVEAGFYTDPYSDFGRLTYEIWRACRLVVDTGIHAFGWSRQQAIDFMADNTALSLHEITTEVDRYISQPGQALAYKIGERKILELRKGIESSLGERFDVREFHDVVLRNGSVPLNILEEQVNSYLESKRKETSDGGRSLPE